MKSLVNDIRLNYPDLDSFIAFKKTKIVNEEYFQGNLKTIRPIASMFKSMILATSVGILLRKNILKSVDSTLESIFPDEVQFFKTKELKK